MHEFNRIPYYKNVKIDTYHSPIYYNIYKKENRKEGGTIVDRLHLSIQKFGET